MRKIIGGVTPAPPPPSLRTALVVIMNIVIKFKERLEVSVEFTVFVEEFVHEDVLMICFQG